jgi:hypothetical protein
VWFLINPSAAGKTARLMPQARSEAIIYAEAQNVGLKSIADAGQEIVLV